MHKLIYERKYIIHFDWEQSFHTLDWPYIVIMLLLFFNFFFIVLSNTPIELVFLKISNITSKYIFLISIGQLVWLQVHLKTVFLKMLRRILIYIVWLRRWFIYYNQEELN